MPFLIPIAIWAGRAALVSLGVSLVGGLLNDGITSAYNDGRSTALSMVEKGIKKEFITIVSKAIFEMLTMAILLLGAIFILGSMSFVSSILNASLLYNLYKFVRYCKRFIPPIFRYKFNIRKYMYDVIHFKVYTHVYNQYADMNFFKKIFLYLTGKDEGYVAHDITERALDLYWDSIILKCILFVVFLIVYGILFNWLLIPRLLSDVTELNRLEVIFYPYQWAFGQIWEILNRFGLIL